MSVDNTDRRRDFYAHYAKHLANRMGLKDWTILVSRHPPENANHNADADCRFGRKTIVISLSESFFSSDEDSQRQTICHELLHAHFAPMHQVILGKSGGQGAWYNAFLSDWEYGIDGVAVAWAEKLPSVSEFKVVSDAYDAENQTVETTNGVPHPPAAIKDGSPKHWDPIDEAEALKLEKAGARPFMGLDGLMYLMGLDGLVKRVESKTGIKSS